MSSYTEQYKGMLDSRIIPEQRDYFAFKANLAALELAAVALSGRPSEIVNFAEKFRAFLLSDPRDASK